MNVADHKCFQNTGSFLLNIIVSLCQCINSAWSSFVTSILYYSVFLTVLPQYLVLVLLLLPHKKWRWKKPAGSGSYKKRPYGYQYCRILWKSEISKCMGQRYFWHLSSFFFRKPESSVSGRKQRHKFKPPEIVYKSAAAVLISGGKTGSQPSGLLAGSGSYL